LAKVPDKPTTIPLLNLEFTSSTAIHVDYAAIQVSENGGAPVLSYELEVYRFETSSWHSVTGGLDRFSLLESHVYADEVVKGERYQLRYRAWNVNGAGEWSESGYILAAQVPSRPETPTYLSSTDTSITLGFTASEDDGGLIISSYVLQLSDLLVTNWQDVYSFVATSSSKLNHTLTTDLDPQTGLKIDPIELNIKYRFRIKAVNDYGSSEWSPTIDLVVASLPSAPVALQKVQSLSSQTSIYIDWQPPTDTEPVVGYQIYMLDLEGGDNLLVWDGARNPDKRWHN
jgi:hypothetical protein